MRPFPGSAGGPPERPAIEAPEPVPIPSVRRPFAGALAASLALHAAVLFLLARAGHRGPEIIGIALVGVPGGAGGPVGEGLRGAEVGHGSATAHAATPEPRDTVPHPPTGAAVHSSAVASVAVPRTPPAARRIASPVAPATPRPKPLVRERAAPAAGSAVSSLADGVSGDSPGGVVALAPGGGGGAGAGGAGGGGDLRAACVACPAPGYPRQAERQGWEGSVDLRLRIDAAGRVTDVAVVRASGFRILDEAAVAAARQSRFRLADEQRRAGGVWGRMRYRFELGG
jgi:protein TonB